MAVSALKSFSYTGNIFVWWNEFLRILTAVMFEGTVHMTQKLNWLIY